MSHYERIWWLEEKSIGGMPQPAIEDIPELYEKGLRAVASFLEGQDNLEEYKANNIEACWIPVEDDEAPTREQAEKFREFVIEMKNATKPLAVHCKGGNGRAGTMLAAYYVLEGKNADEVLSWMRGINPKAVRTQVQEEFLRSL